MEIVLQLAVIVVLRISLSLFQWLLLCFLFFWSLHFFFFLLVMEAATIKSVTVTDDLHVCFIFCAKKVAAIGESQFQASINERQTTIFLVTILLHCPSFCVIPFATQANSLFQF